MILKNWGFESRKIETLIIEFKLHNKEFDLKIFQIASIDYYLQLFCMLTWSRWGRGISWYHTALLVVCHLLWQSPHRTSRCRRQCARVRLILCRMSYSYGRLEFRVATGKKWLKQLFLAIEKRKAIFAAGNLESKESCRVITMLLFLLIVLNCWAVWCWSSLIFSNYTVCVDSSKQ